MTDTPGYEYDFDPEATNNTAASVFRLAAEGGDAVLDLGSGPGIVAAALQTKLGRNVTCVDVNPELLAAARKRGVAETIVADLTRADWVKALHGRRFDVILLADVLEHLADPGAVLTAIRANEMLEDDGFLVVSIPNAAHEAVVGELLTGHFTYQPTGLLDRTHLRFFTRDSFTELAEESGFDVAEMRRTLRTLEQTEFKGRAHDLDADAREVLGRRGLEGRTYQYVMRLVPLTAGARTAELARRIEQLQSELLDARHAASVAEEEAASAHAELAEREVLDAELADLRKGIRGFRRLLAEQRAEEIRRTAEMAEVIAQKDAALDQVNADLAAAARRERVALRQVDRLRESFTWKAGRVVKGLVTPLVKVRNLMTGRRSTSAAPMRSAAPTVPAVVPAATPAPVGMVSVEMETAESELRVSYEEEAARSDFAGTGGRRVAFATYTVDFDEGRGDLYVAVGIGRKLRRQGADVIYRPRQAWYAYRDTPDVVVAMIPTFRPGRLEAEVTSVAWVRNEVDNWLAHPELQLFDAILCSSERSRRAIAEIYAGPTGVLPIGVDTELFSPAPDEPRAGVVSTANQWGRELDVNRALRSTPISFPLSIYGHTRGLAETLRPHAHGPVSFFSLPTLYRQARIALDDFNHTTVAWGNVNSRLYESLAAGALPVTNTARGLADLGLGEVPTFGSPTELNSLVQGLLDDPEGTDALARRLSEVVRSRHGYEHRAGTLVEFLDSIEGKPTESRTVVGFFPDYRISNPYQDMLYGSLPEMGAVAVPVGLDAVGALEPPFRRTEGHRVFHLHWTAPILGPSRTEPAALAAMEEFLGRLDRFIEEQGRFVWTVHNVLPHQCRFPRIEAMLRQELAYRAEAIHVMCPATAAATEDLYHLPEDRLRLVRHSSFIGVYPDGYDRERARSELGVGPDDIALVALGGIRPYKGIDRLLDAFDLALSREPRLRLIVAGKPGVFADAAEIEARCRSHPRVLANFSVIPDDELQVFFKAADVVVLPHRRVLNSGALLLAYTFGRPVIAPVTGCLAELLDPACSIGFESNDARSLTAALADAGTLATHDARLAARTVAESYLPSDMAGDFAAVLGSLLASQPG